MKYLITYDLVNPGQDYSTLYDAIGELGNTIHGMQNVWFLESELTATEIRDELRQHIDTNDKLFVCIVGNWASTNLSGVAFWLNDN